MLLARSDLGRDREPSIHGKGSPANSCETKNPKIDGPPVNTPLALEGSECEDAP